MYTSCMLSIVALVYSPRHSFPYTILYFVSQQSIHERQPSRNCRRCRREHPEESPRLWNFRSQCCTHPQPRRQRLANWSHGDCRSNEIYRNWFHGAKAGIGISEGRGGIYQNTCPRRDECRRGEQGPIHSIFFAKSGLCYGIVDCYRIGKQ